MNGSTRLALAPEQSLKAACKRLAKAAPAARGDAESAVWTALTRLYPVLAGTQPLAVGIYKKLAAAVPEVPRTFLRRHLAHHVSLHAYRVALARPGARRVNLDLTDAGEVSARHRAHAGVER